MAELNGHEPRIVGLVCEWSVDLNGHTLPDGTLKEMPNVKVVQVPCTGFIKPATVELALKKGADGIFICGCPVGDCHYREGNLFIRARVMDERQPRLRRDVDRRRVGMAWLSALERGAFLKALQEFSTSLKELLAQAPPVRR